MSQRNWPRTDWPLHPKGTQVEVTIGCPTCGKSHVLRGVTTHLTNPLNGCTQTTLDLTHACVRTVEVLSRTGREPGTFLAPSDMLRPIDPVTLLGELSGDG